MAGSRVTVESGGRVYLGSGRFITLGEAIRLITAGLSDPIQGISDEIVIAIILICGYDVCVPVRKFEPYSISQARIDIIRVLRGSRHTFERCRTYYRSKGWRG